MNKESLATLLRQRGVEVELRETLKGGTVSQVYSGRWQGQTVVIKHTEDLEPFDPTEIRIDKAGHLVDTEILKRLAGTEIEVPKVLAYFPEITTTVMEDVRGRGVELLQTKINRGELPEGVARLIGRRLGQLGQEMRRWERIRTNETGEESIYERGLELRLIYPNQQREYLELEKRFLAHNQYLCWPDGHPKNILVDNESQVVFIDFGRSVYGDQDYMLPNFLAHIVIYALAGYVEREQAKRFGRAVIAGYQEITEDNEVVMVKYLAMEVLHRAFGKWIEGVKTREQKLRLVEFGLGVFDDKVKSWDELWVRV